MTKRMKTIDNNYVMCSDYDPATQRNSIEEFNYVGDLFEYTHKALDHYNETHKNDPFTLLDPLALWYFNTNYWRDGDLHHLSFIAASSINQNPKLFFAEFALNGQIQICTTVDPGSPLVSTRCGACHPDGVIYHPRYDSEFYPRGCSRRLITDHAYAKKFFRDVYTIKTDVKELDYDDTCELLIEYKGLALEALEKFNHDKGVSYEFEGLVSCNRFVCKDVTHMATFWAHLTFQAKVKSGDGSGSSSVLFFAEVGITTSDVDVTTCMIIPTTDDSAVPLSRERSRCLACPMYHHPEGRYFAGYEGGAFVDSLYKGCFRAIKSELIMKTDDASQAAREEYHRYLWCGGAGKSASSSQRRAR